MSQFHSLSGFSSILLELKSLHLHILIVLVDDYLFLHELEEPLTIPIWIDSRDVFAVGGVGLVLVFNLLVPDELLQVVDDADVVDVHSIGTHEGIFLVLIARNESLVVISAVFQLFLGACDFWIELLGEFIGHIPIEVLEDSAVRSLLRSHFLEFIFRVTA